MRQLGKRRIAVMAAWAVAALVILCQKCLVGAEKLEVQAYVGQPFGVGKVTVPLTGIFRNTVSVGEGIWLEEKSDRTLYPAYRELKARTLPRGRESQSDSITVFFLFRGSEPLDLNFVVGQNRRVTAMPDSDATSHRALLGEWWETYLSMTEQSALADYYPPQVENYLSAMLARRLKLEPPHVTHRWSGNSTVDEIFGTLAGAESIRVAMQKETLLAKAGAVEVANLPLPVAVTPPAVEIPKVPEVVAIEPIARHVPAECFYLRCGSFDNFQWLRQTIDFWGGNLRDLAAVRGLDYDVRGHLERQLALQETVLSKLLGDAVVADVALIGTDTFFREGAAFGVLFQAKNNAVFSAAIKSQRQAARNDKSAAGETVQERAVEIGGHPVSVLESPDNSVRSFYATDGDNHLVTTSQTIVRRFFEAGAGQDSLADLKEFQYGRSITPLSRNDTLFVYLSDPWFRLLASPAYRVEMTRRMQAEVEIELVHLARLAARAEQAPADTIEQLVASGFLPEQFGRRPDGSRSVLIGDAIVDSLRGARRSFLPIPDVAVARVTPTESKSYMAFAQTYRSQWERVDPVIAGIKREVRQFPEGPREKVTVDLHITPYAKAQYGFLAAVLTAPTKTRFGRVPGNVIEVQARALGLTLFAGVRDFSPRFVFNEGRVRTDGDLDDVPIYLGNTPGTHDILGGIVGPIPEGYSKQSGWFSWVRKFDDFLVRANDRAALEAATPHLKVEDAERPAQLRFYVADLGATQMAPALNAYGYERSRMASAGNAYFMDALIQQLHVPKDDAFETMRRTLAARPVCPLGGKYKPGKMVPWSSSAWAHEFIGREDRVPAGYKSPFLDWFHGLDLEFSIDATTLTTHIELELQPRDGQTN